MNCEKLGPNLSFSVEYKASNLHKRRLSYLKYNELGIPLPQNFINEFINELGKICFLLRKIKFR